MALDSQPEEIPLEKRNSRLYIMGIVLTGFISITTIATMVIRTQLRPVEPLVVEQVVQATPTPKPEIVAIDRAEISLEVLNGSGKRGFAGQTAEKFTELGYEIEEIGNADATDTTVIYADEEQIEELGNLLEDIESELGVSEILPAKDDLAGIAQIILGTDQN
jgi:hypothetical protein